MTTVIDMLCAAWRAASDGAYLGWNEFTEGGIKDRERKQMLAVIDALADGVSENPAMVQAFRAQWANSLSKHGETIDAVCARGLAAAIRAAKSREG